MSWPSHPEATVEGRLNAGDGLVERSATAISQAGKTLGEGETAGRLTADLGAVSRKPR